MLSRSDDDNDALRDTGHDLHFLSRLERVGIEQADLALRLYRSPALVKQLLDEPGVAPGTSRIAIAMEPGEAPPLVLVERSGAFVTCLAAGMRLGDGVPVVGWERLAKCLRRSEQEQREVNAFEEAHPRFRTLMKRFRKTADRFSREDFRQMMAVEPFVRLDFRRSVLETYAWIHRNGPEAARARWSRRSDRPFIVDFWQAAHQLEHLMLLSAIGGRPSFEEFIGTVGMTIGEILLSTVYLPVFWLGNAPIAYRAMWAIARMGKLALPLLKKRLQEVESPIDWLAAAHGLFALAIAHRKLRGEVLSVLDYRPRTGLPWNGWFGAKNMDGFQRAVAACCEEDEPGPDGMSMTAREALLLLLRSRVGAALAGNDGIGSLVDDNGLVEPDLATGAFLRLHYDFLSNKQLTLLTLAVPIVARLEAEDFFLPAAVANRVGLEDVAEGVSLLARTYGDGGPPRPEPKRSEATPGRNAPCPCGSGKKYKRCCGV